MGVQQPASWASVTPHFAPCTPHPRPRSALATQKRSRHRRLHVRYLRVPPPPLIRPHTPLRHVLPAHTSRTVRGGCGVRRSSFPPTSPLALGARGASGDLRHSRRRPHPASPGLPRHAPVRPPTRRPHCALSPQPCGELAFVRASHSHSGERSAPRRAPEHPPPPRALCDFGALPAPPLLPTSSVESSITAAISDPPLHHTACSLARARPPCVCAPGLHATATAAAADASSSRGGGLGGGQRRCRREVWRRSTYL